MNFWLVVTTEQNWRICLEHRVWGVEGNAARTIARAELGDEILVHLDHMRSGGIVKVSSAVYYDETRIWPDRVYPHRIRFGPVLIPSEAVDIRDFYGQNLSAKDPRGYFRSTMRSLPKEEFTLFRGFLEKKTRKQSPAERSMVPFEVGRIYSRSEIHARHGGQEQGGISTPAEYPIVLLFTGESGGKYGYTDGWEPDGTFQYSGEGQIGDMDFSGGNLAVRDHAQRGEDLHLFQYVSTGKVRYIGQMVYAGHRLIPNVPDRNGNPRTAIVFQLAPLLSEIREEAPVDSAGSEVRRSWYWEQPLQDVRAAAVEPQRTELKPQQARRNVYHRSEAVRVYVLRRANGLCEGCGKPAPFMTRDGRPYLEPHHTSRLSDGGPDHPKWVIAVCPTCHRRAHYADDAETYNESLKSLAIRLDSQTQETA